ncbi:unnamed protein product [Ceratitis capitata]|uniref:(Mediterranean fruit fly) hypothetical protein n=1 Tax=Ceratitis capitata TaxID=7213 RepID=A0A811UW10_CERCA|nr:unnamed protein product [Ceratitis capitata]
MHANDVNKPPQWGCNVTEQTLQVDFPSYCTDLIWLLKPNSPGFVRNIKSSNEMKKFKKKSAARLRASASLPLRAVQSTIKALPAATATATAVSILKNPLIFVPSNPQGNFNVVLIVLVWWCVFYFIE